MKGSFVPRIENKIALVTGAASGIGAATSRRFIAEGASVTLTDINADAGADLARELGNKAIFVEQDVTDPDAWSQAVQQTTEAFGGLDILVNNAGIGTGGSIEDQTLEEWQQVMKINSDAVFLGCKAAVEAMKKRGGGSIKKNRLSFFVATDKGTGGKRFARKNREYSGPAKRLAWFPIGSGDAWLFECAWCAVFTLPCRRRRSAIEYFRFRF